MPANPSKQTSADVCSTPAPLVTITLRVRPRSIMPPHPDATTLLKFLRLLRANDLTRARFDEINAHLAEQGLLMGAGTSWTPRSS